MGKINGLINVVDLFNLIRLLILKNEIIIIWVI